MESWLRIAIFVLILLSFLRRIFKLKAQGGAKPPTTAGVPPARMRRPLLGKKNDFRDVPPPPENPDLG
ncbi:MAG TPA: hypothetical protein VMI10_19495 [Terriglobales bacterium]|nr:hypothetical protein [Terriglobales bacterium]